MKLLNTAEQLQIVAGLPQALIDYIWQLVQAFPHKKREQAVLFLRPVSLGGCALQELRVCAGDREERRRLFGFSPVTADILVDYTATGCVMHLARVGGCDE